MLRNAIGLKMNVKYRISGWMLAASVGVAIFLTGAPVNAAD
jgi:hypothetical protein